MIFGVVMGEVHLIPLLSHSNMYASALMTLINCTDALFTLHFYPLICIYIFECKSANSALCQYSPIHMVFSLSQEIFTTSTPTKPHIHRNVPRKGKKMRDFWQRWSTRFSAPLVPSCCAGLYRYRTADSSANLILGRVLIFIVILDSLFWAHLASPPEPSALSDPPCTLVLVEPPVTPYKMYGIVQEGVDTKGCKPPRAFILDTHSHLIVSLHMHTRVHVFTYVSTHNYIYAPYTYTTTS